MTNAELEIVEGHDTEEDTLVALIRAGEIGAFAVDTCVYRSNQFKPLGALRSITSMRQRGIPFLMPEVWEREIKRLLAEELEGKFQALSAHLTDMASMKMVELESAIDTLVKCNASTAAFGWMEAHLEECKPTRLPTPWSDIGPKVLNDYFDVALPFERTTKKRKEFPDALAIHTLAKFESAKKKKILVVSGDKGCRGAAHRQGMIPVSDLMKASRCVELARSDIDIAALEKCLNDEWKTKATNLRETALNWLVKNAFNQVIITPLLATKQIPEGYVVRAKGFIPIDLDDENLSRFDYSIFSVDEETIVGAWTPPGKAVAVVVLSPGAGGIAGGRGPVVTVDLKNPPLEAIQLQEEGENLVFTAEIPWTDLQPRILIKRTDHEIGLIEMGSPFVVADFAHGQRQARDFISF